MRLDNVVRIYSPNTTSRSYMTGMDGIKCVHYGDIYKNYTDKELKSSDILNSISIDYPEQKIIKQNAIIIADVSETIDDWGHVTFINFDGTPYINGTHTIAIVSDCETTLRYLFFLLRNDTNIKMLRQFLTGVTVFQMSIKSLSSFKLELPPIPTQTRIADILSVYDDVIENNNRRIALLEKAARELYREWFVRFRFSGYEKAKFVNGLPEGWEVKKVGDIVGVGRGSSPRPITDGKYFSNGDIPWIKIADATKSTKFILETKEYVNEYGASFSRKLPVGSMIIAASGTLGFPMFLGVEGCIHDGWMYFFDISETSKEYLYFVLLSLGQYYNSISYGAAIQNINTEIIRNSKVIIPRKTILGQFTAIISNIDCLIQNLLRQSQNLARQRDLLLPRLMSGKLEV
ncbi:MAG: restriction endonuclease subunit S [Treponema sp.]|nr:restriction endonuclease subunit S [Treponema sp.]